MTLGELDRTRWDRWVRLWAAAAERMKRLGALDEAVTIKGPATERELAEIEANLGAELPHSFRDVLSTFAAGVSFFWEFPDDIARPQELQDIASGGVLWSSRLINPFERSRRDTVRSLTPDVPGYERWKHSLALTASRYGEGLLGLDLRQGNDPPVVRLDFGGAKTDEEAFVAPSFVEFIDRWTMLAGAGPEEWALDPFIPTLGAGIDPNSKIGVLWRGWLGFEDAKK